jgi:hypothetical protein
LAGRQDHALAGGVLETIGLFDIPLQQHRQAFAKEDSLDLPVINDVNFVR